MAYRLRARAFASVGEFRRRAQVEGLTIVADDQAADKALKVLQRLGDRVHGWDTETTEVRVGQRGQTPCHTGRVVCATAYCGEDVDFGNGPKLLLDNTGPAAGLIGRKFRTYFEDKAYKKVFHNYAFDMLMLKREKIHLQGLAADTLVLARLHDTSLASWEGLARQQKLIKEQSTERAFQRSTKVVPTRALQRVVFGKKSLELDQVGSQMHSISIPVLEETNKLRTIARRRTGYDLKSLALRYGFADDEGQSFSDLFGTTPDAAMHWFDCPTNFARFARYAAQDAVYTFQLFHLFKESLVQTPWQNTAAPRPMTELLLDDAVADELRAARSSHLPRPFKMPRTKGDGEGMPGTCTSVQYRTGKTMWDFYTQHMGGFSECLAAMQERGIGVDMEKLKQIEAEASKDLERLEKQFQELLGEIRLEGETLNPHADKMNVHSALQLRTLLFGGAKNLQDESELEVVKDFPVAPGVQADSKRFQLSTWGLSPRPGRKYITETGWPSTSKEALAKLQGDSESNVRRQLELKGWDPEMAAKAHEALEVRREMGSVKTLLRTFAKPLQEHASEAGRIHPSWSYGTSTGRLTCSNPNLQQLPGDKDTYNVRSAFVAAPGNSFIIADYSQLELRVLAHVSKCESMRVNFLKGGDYHSEVAAEMYPHIKEAIARGEVSTKGSADVPSVKSVYPRERTSAKAINFGIVYGASTESLADDLGISQERAEELYEAWFENKKAVKSWIFDVKQGSALHRVSRSLLGRHRHLPMLAEDAPRLLRSRSERAALNFAIQGSAADLVTGAMIQLEKHEKLQELGFRLLLQVHDEFVLEGPCEHAEEAKVILEEIMKKPLQEALPDFKMSVPLEVSLSVSKTLSGKV